MSEQCQLCTKYLITHDMYGRSEIVMGFIDIRKGKKQSFECTSNAQEIELLSALATEA